MAFNNFPYTSFQDLNLDWVLRKLREAVAQATQAARTVAGFSTRLENVETSDNLQNTRLVALTSASNTQAADIVQLKNSDNTQNQKISTLESTDNQQNQRISTLEQNDADNVKVTAQDFDETDKNIARNNIGAGTSTVTYDDEMEAIIIEDVRTGNLETVPVGGGGGGSSNAVLYTAQTLTNAQKTQARQNISAGISTVTYNPNTGILTIIDADTGTPTAYLVPSDTVRYGAVQSLTAAEQEQARDNIGAGTGTSIVRVNASDGTITVTDPDIASGNPMTYQYRTIFPINAVYSNGEYTFNRNQADIFSAIVKGQLPVVKYHTTAGQSDYDVYYEWVLDYYTYDGEDAYIYFSRVDQYGNSAQLKWYASTGKATEISRPTLPPATGADDGKIPMVNSFGNYQLVTPSSAQGTPKVTMASTDTTAALDANKFYVFPEMASLSVTLNTPASNTIVNEFHFRFTSGATATQFDLPASVIIPDDFDVLADTVYEISIIDNYMVYSSWAVSA